MRKASSCPEFLWHLDGNRKDLALLGETLEAYIPAAKIQRFDTYDKALQGIEVGEQSNAFPKVFVADRTGFCAPAEQTPFAYRIQASSPLTISFLCSNSAYEDPAKIELWRTAHLIAADFRKHQIDQLAAIIAKCLQRWERPVLQQFRNYILSECSDPETRYFPKDDYSEHLNVYDLHREMVLGTPLGLEQEKAWDMVFNGSGELALALAKANSSGEG